MAVKLRGVLFAISLVLLCAYFLGLSSSNHNTTITGKTTSMDASSCPFCTIATSYTPSDHAVPTNPDPDLVNPNCYLILSTELVIAFLDIMPISPGHVLVVSRSHREKLSDLKPAESAALGLWLPIVSRAVMRALGRDGGDWNVVQNNGKSPKFRLKRMEADSPR
ncbi:MAG: hypothetical protein M1828_002764 [Chrysothrix sp. TS-e1954]|nr:MAG: hypothetical protein M1828_002764 [Chrysothrix sp. TS-e1954]